MRPPGTEESICDKNRQRIRRPPRSELCGEHPKPARVPKDSSIRHRYIMKQCRFLYPLIWKVSRPVYVELTFFRGLGCHPDTGLILVEEWIGKMPWLL